jgi:hypothetical protein
MTKFSPPGNAADLDAALHYLVRGGLAGRVGEPFLAVPYDPLSFSPWLAVNARGRSQEAHLLAGRYAILSASSPSDGRRLARWRP